ncbi:NUDIX hydrolase [Halalkalicoccus subterraneus]|uniref:NUDIX hydrolase n=1 Tax=Halalkalicoccus subterraneus TaxID=2675002 RepID=UPI000EFC6156|nr:NUDIX domain-containing protein [Halalkalicoccus subterraneus]
MTTIDKLWFRASEASQRAERAYHRLRERHDACLERERHRRVSRGRFRTLTERVERTGAPYGAHTIVYRPSGELLLVRHDGVDLWVLPGGEVDPEEDFERAAVRELAEEAGVDAEYDGLGILTRVRITCGEYETVGVVPVFTARALTTETHIADPDDEISAARWFADLPEDTRDREDLLAWREREL